MKQIWIALSFALFAPACMTPLPQDSAAESPQTSVAASPLTSPAPFDAACDQACDDAYEACLDNATSDSDACNCDNGRIICEHRCGHGGALHPCF